LLFKTYRRQNTIKGKGRALGIALFTWSPAALHILRSGSWAWLARANDTAAHNAAIDCPRYSASEHWTHGAACRHPTPQSTTQATTAKSVITTYCACNHGGMARLSWAQLGDWLYTEMVYRPTYGHTSKYYIIGQRMANHYWYSLVGLYKSLFIIFLHKKICGIALRRESNS